MRRAPHLPGAPSVLAHDRAAARARAVRPARVPPHARPRNNGTPACPASDSAWCLTPVWPRSRAARCSMCARRGSRRRGTPCSALRRTRPCTSTGPRSAARPSTRQCPWPPPSTRSARPAASSHGPAAVTRRLSLSQNVGELHPARGGRPAAQRAATDVLLARLSQGDGPAGHVHALRHVQHQLDMPCAWAARCAALRRLRTHPTASAQHRRATRHAIRTTRPVFTSQTTSRRLPAATAHASARAYCPT